MTYFVRGKKVVKVDGAFIEVLEVTQIDEKSLSDAKAVACGALVMENYDVVDLFDTSSVRVFGIKRC